MRQNQLKFIQAGSDLIIPLLGYFVWNWSLFFIVLFLLIDLFVFAVISFLKDQKIQQHQARTYQFPFKHLGLTLVTFLVILALINQGFRWHTPNFKLLQNTLQFLATKEMGIPQGILLLPLITLGSYMQFKTQFILNRAFEKTSTQAIWKIHHLTNVVVLIATSVLISLIYLFFLPDWVYLLLIAVGSMSYRFFVRTTT